MIKGDKLRQLRHQKGVSADEAANALKMSKSQLLNYENEKSDPSTDALIRLMHYYNVSADYLLGETDLPRRSVLTIGIKPPEVLQKLGLERAVNWFKEIGVPIRIEPIDIVELLHIFPPETVATFLKKLDINININGLSDEKPDEPEDDLKP